MKLLDLYATLVSPSSRADQQQILLLLYFKAPISAVSNSLTKKRVLSCKGNHVGQKVKSNYSHLV